MFGQQGVEKNKQKVCGCKQQEAGEDCLTVCYICCNHQQNGGRWRGRGCMCLAGRGRVKGIIQNKKIYSNKLTTGYKFWKQGSQWKGNIKVPIDSEVVVCSCKLGLLVSRKDRWETVVKNNSSFLLYTRQKITWEFRMLLK